MHHIVEALQEKAIPIKQSCRVLGVSRSGYYEAMQAKAKPKSTELEAKVMNSFADSFRTYGSRRIKQALCSQGVKIGRYKVRRLMRECSLSSVWRKKSFVTTTDSKHSLPVAPNVLDRQFTQKAPDRAYVADITYIPTGSGWLYLAVVLDLFSRRVVGWATASTMHADLVCRALNMAIVVRQPGPGLIVHSDRGSQYASAQYQALLAHHRFVCSMSRKGNCWDNAVAERFFLNLKVERVWQQRYANQLEAQKDIAGYIAGFYNTVRINSAADNLPPVAFEQLMAEKPCEVSGIT